MKRKNNGDSPAEPEEELRDAAPDTDGQSEEPDADPQNTAPDADIRGEDPKENVPPAKPRRARGTRRAKSHSGKWSALMDFAMGHRKYVIPGAFALILVFIVIPFMLNASKLGRSVGGSAGEKVGLALGSVEGLSEAGENYSKGKQAGLTADDIDVVVESAIRGTGKLQVLAMKGKATDLIEIGDNFNARIGTRIDVIFTVDLASAVVENGTITLDEPVASGNIDENDMERLDSSDTSFWGIDGKDTYTATMNELNLLRRESRDPSQYTEWLPHAKQAAENQILALVRAIHGNTPDFPDPEIVWRGAAEDASEEG